MQWCKMLTRPCVSVSQTEFIFIFRFFGFFRPRMRPTLVNGGQDRGRGERRRWIVAVAGGHTGGLPVKACGRARLCVQCIVGSVEQSDLLREGFACDAEVTHSFPPPRLPDTHWRSYLWRLHHHGELGPISRSLFPQVRKSQTRLKKKKTAGELWDRDQPHRLCTEMMKSFQWHQPLLQIYVFIQGECFRYPSLGSESYFTSDSVWLRPQSFTCGKSLNASFSAGSFNPLYLTWWRSLDQNIVRNWACAFCLL